jgi:hypothetical protein
MENENEVILDTTNEAEEETVEIPETETEEETIETEPEVDVVQLQATNKKLFERAKKAEADLKALKGNIPQAKKPAQQTSSPVDVDERILVSQGMSQELLKELKVISKVRGVGLIEAQADPIFVAVKEKFDAEQKQKKASVPASRGSGSPTVRKDFKTPGLTAAEHRKMVESLK